MEDSIFVGLEVHKATTSVPVAEGLLGGEIRNLGIIANRADQVAKRDGNARYAPVWTRR
ncbi:hypothetical protein [Bradyrhizobium sp. ARR65]|uniref:hypothetical protein n=1 Tax=Bradyrhizobium sp. ARR65 TaxID=1040989 RepID=UPI000A899FCA|nr:hypothetical protein [Bradyrhizobium sp. ARR65]